MDAPETPPVIPGLPDNAYRPLKPGESYAPLIPAAATVREVSGRSIVLGLVMTVLFSAAATFIALKLGQGIETAIPIAILAVGASSLAAAFGRRPSTMLENLQVATLGATAGIVVGGSVFTMPAIYVLGLQGRSGFFQIFIVPLMGALLGVVFLIPFRRYFVAEMHGKLPFPEATAITEILVTGERGGSQAKILLYSMGIGLVVDFLALHFRLWSDVFTTALVGPLRRLTDDAKAVFALNTSAAVLGLGYIIGVRYASIICAGSFLSYFVLIPLFAHLGSFTAGEVFPGRPPLAGLGHGAIFRDYVRHIGIGGIFGAGILSIVRMSPVIVQAVRQVFAEIGRLRRGTEGPAPARNDQDIPLSRVLGFGAVLAAAIWLYFRFSVLAGAENAFTLSVVAVAITLLVAFLFAAVSAWAVAMISVTPISGMTLTTLILTAVILAKLGLTGQQGMLATLLIGGVVCTALSMTGSMVTIMKTGYWIGARPRTLQLALIGGSVLASLTVTGVILLFSRTYGYVPGPETPNPMAAPQANAMAAVLQSVMQSAAAPWFLYIVGAVIAVIVQMLGISALAFALGMYLPIELNTPLLAGALVGAWARKSADPILARVRGNRGTLIASGFIAGGALAGVLDGLVKLILAEGFDLRGIQEFWYPETTANWIGLLVFAGLGAFLFWDVRQARAEEDTGREIAM
jgi:putative OPT family oligopeptide transporter